MTEQQILHTLDNSNDGYYCSFVELGQAYSYQIDTRLNVFRGDGGRWAIAIERLGYNPQAGAIILDIHYYGNCLINLESYNDRPTSYYSIHPIDSDNFNETIENEVLRPHAKFWLVRGQRVPLSHDKQDYINAGIELKEIEPDEISAEEVGRLVILTNRDIFRASDKELYKSIPADLKKILVLDEWFHKDFKLLIAPPMTEEHLLQTYEFNKSLTGLGGMTFGTFAESFRQQKKVFENWNKKIRRKNRPGSYETWQLIAKVIATNNPVQYKPTLQPNTHWKNWSESGSL